MTGCVRQRGFGIVEIMVAMTIGLMLVTGIYAIFISSRRTQEMDQSIASLQQSARFLHMRLSRAIRMAGAGGCETLSSKSIAVDARNLGSWAGSAVNGLDNVSQDNAYGARPGTDVLTVAEISPRMTTLAANSNPQSATLKVVANNQLWLKGHDVLVTDCYHGDIFAISNTPNNHGGSGEVTLTHGADVNRTSKLNYSYASGATVAAFEYKTYFVKATGRKAPDGQPDYGFYVDANGASTLLVDHASNFQVDYGVDTTPNDGVDNVGAYVPANQVSDWSMVRAVRIELVLRSANPFAAPSVQAYPLGLDQSDRRFKLLVSDIVSIRNANS